MSFFKGCRLRGTMSMTRGKSANIPSIARMQTGSCHFFQSINSSKILGCQWDDQSWWRNISMPLIAVKNFSSFFRCFYSLREKASCYWWCEALNPSDLSGMYWRPLQVLGRRGLCCDFRPVSAVKPGWVHTHAQGGSGNLGAEGFSHAACGVLKA